MGFNKELFAELLDKAKGNRSINNYGRLSDVDPGYISRLLRGLVKKPPSAVVISKLAERAHNGVTAEDLMRAAGYLGTYVRNDEEVEYIKEESPETYYTLTEKDERDIAKKLDALLNELDSDSALSFLGEPMSEEDRELLRISLENTVRLSKEMAKKKFTPKKYRN